MELQAVVAVVSGLVVFIAVMKYGLDAVQQHDWYQQAKQRDEVEARRWGGDGTS